MLARGKYRAGQCTCKSRKKESMMVHVRKKGEIRKKHKRCTERTPLSLAEIRKTPKVNVRVCESAAYEYMCG
jgi:hypothetical protein